MTPGLLRAYWRDVLDFVFNRPRFEVYEVIPRGAAEQLQPTAWGRGLPELPYWRWRLIRRGRVIAFSPEEARYPTEASARTACLVYQGMASDAEIDTL